MWANNKDSLLENLEVRVNLSTEEKEFIMKCLKFKRGLLGRFIFNNIKLIYLENK